MNAIADLLLRMLGEEPAAYPDANDKWPAILAVTIDMAVPIVILALLILPLLIIKLRKKKLTPFNIGISLLIGAGLAYGAYYINEWSYGYGIGVIFHEIYGN